MQEYIQKISQQTDQLQMRVLQSRLRFLALKAVAKGEKLPRCPRTGAVLGRTGVNHDGN